MEHCLYKGECGLSPPDLLLADHTVFIDRLKQASLWWREGRGGQVEQSCLDWTDRGGIKLLTSKMVVGETARACGGGSNC